ncbi:MAG: 50S ribosomal protein L22 [Oscillospiraceae bacterium]|nr:50S ribosomal protein L22 [Oscillospiraceae bacterium]
MEATAHLKYLRISPRKVKISLDLIRGKDVGYAFSVLNHTPKAASEHLIKLLNSAVANAENNLGMTKERLFISKCFASPGPTLKRIRARARGRSARILKRTSHITIKLEEKE